MNGRGLLAALALAAIGAAEPVAADVEAGTDMTEVSIEGSWNFRAFTYDDCEFTGMASLLAGEEPGLYACELTARQSCPAVEWVVRQSCVGHRTGDRLVIRSTIEEFLVGAPTASYWPDNFILKIKSDQLMTGSLVSHGSHAAEFVRQAEGIS